MTCVIRISNALRLAGVNEGSHSFTFTFIHIRYEPSCLYSPAAEYCPVLAGTHFQFKRGRRLSWPGWIGEILRWFARPKTVTHPVLQPRRP